MKIKKFSPLPRFKGPLGEKTIVRPGAALGALLAASFLLVQSQGAFAQHQHTLPLFMSASDMARQGFVRIINRSDQAGTVRIHAIDDSGRQFGPVYLTLAAKATVHFNSGDLEQGNLSKGLSGGVGSGEGNWRLKLDTDLDIEPLAYIRTPDDGFLTSIHDVAQGQSMRWHVPTFNPGSNRDQRSLLRVINTSGIDTEVVIEGLDDRGGPAPEGEVRFTLPADAARTLSAEELEEGYSESESDFAFDGRFGDGTGKWQLFVSAGRPIQAMSLMTTPTGHLTNLSSVTGDDVIRGGPGNDVLYGGSGSDVINPEDNDDGTDVVHGSAGDDRIVYTASGPSAYQELRYSDPDMGDYLSTGGITATIDGVTNRATVEKGSAGTDTIVDIVNPLRAAWHPPNGGFGLYGTSSSDVFHLTLDDEQWMKIVGGAGDDTFNVRGSRIVLLDYRDAENGINVDLRTGTVRNDGFGDADTINGAVWAVSGTDFSDVIRGSDRSESFIGRAGEDVIDGRGGEDRLRFDREGEVENLVVDVVEGTATGTWNGGSFSYTISSIERLYGGAGGDTFHGGAGDADREDLGGADDFRVHGSAGNDRYVYTDRSGASRLQYQEITYVDLTGGIRVTIDGDANRATVDKGAAGADTIVDIVDPLGGDGAFGIYGTNSNDVFDLTFDDDDWIQVAGLEGDDTFRIRSGSVRIDYPHSLVRNGIDVDLRAGRVSNDGFGDVDTIHGYVWEVCGTRFSDVIRGSDEGESFIGRAGEDIIDGRGGVDRLRFDGCNTGYENVEVDLGAGTATGTWRGEEFSYTLHSIEHVRGSENDDIFVSGPGDDRFEGRGGNDEFVFGRGHGDDTIDRFADGEDKIVLLGLDLDSKSDVIEAAHAYSQGVGVWIDLRPYGGGTLSISGLPFDRLDASDFLL